MAVSEKGKMLKKKSVKHALTVLNALHQKFTEKKSKKSLLDDASENSIYLQITLKKIPSTKLTQIIKVPLPYPLTASSTEICLITGDLEKNNKKAEIEPTVLYYKELLKEKGITNINEVIPLRQLRTEYKTFESKRQLAAAYDVFLTDSKIAGCLPKILGKAVFSNRKFPLQIDLKTAKLKSHIDKALSKTTLLLSCRGNSCTLEFGRLGMEDNEVIANLLACVKVLAEKLPGKWSNVLGLYIKTAKSKAIPVFMSFDNPNDVNIKVIRNREKMELQELSTFPNTRVKVFRDGRIIVDKTDVGKKDGAADEKKPIVKSDSNEKEDFKVDISEAASEEEEKLDTKFKKDRISMKRSKKSVEKKGVKKRKSLTERSVKTLMAN